MTQDVFSHCVCYCKPKKEREGCSDTSPRNVGTVAPISVGLFDASITSLAIDRDLASMLRVMAKSFSYVGFFHLFLALWLKSYFIEGSLCCVVKLSYFSCLVLSIFPAAISLLSPSSFRFAPSDEAPDFS